MKPTANGSKYSKFSQEERSSILSQPPLKPRKFKVWTEVQEKCSHFSSHPFPGQFSTPWLNSTLLHGMNQYHSQCYSAIGPFFSSVAFIDVSETSGLLPIFILIFELQAIINGLGVCFFLLQASRIPLQLHLHSFSLNSNVCFVNIYYALTARLFKMFHFQFFFLHCPDW